MRAIAGFLVKNAETGETEAVAPGHPRYEACLAARRMMTMRDINGLCKDNLTEKNAELEKQAISLAEFQQVLRNNSVPPKHWDKARQLHRSGMFRGALMATPVVGAGMLGASRIIDHLKRKREQQSPPETWGPTGDFKTASFTPSRENSQLLAMLRSKLVQSGTRDA